MAPKKEKKNNKKYLIIIIIIIIIALLLAFWKVYSSVSQSIVGYNTETMQELAAHDEQIINNSLKNRIESIEGLAGTVQKQKYSSVTDLMSSLKRSGSFLPDTAQAGFVSDNGKVYKSSGSVTEEEFLYETCVEANGQSFCARYVFDKFGVVEARAERFTVGVPVSMEVDGVRFIYLTVNFRISTLEDELKVSSFGGRGYSSIIDESGRYLLNLSERHFFGEMENFFDDYKGAEFEGYSDADGILEAAKAGQINTSFKYGGKEYLLLIAPIKNVDWYFISFVPVEVFQQQSNTIMKIFLTLMAVIFAAVAVSVIFLFRNRAQEQRLHEAEVIEKRDKIVRRLSSDYERVEIVSIEEDESEDVALLISDRYMNTYSFPGIDDTKPLKDQFLKLIDAAAYPEEKDSICKAVARDTIIGKLKENPIYDVQFRTVYNNVTHWYNLRFSALDPEDVTQGMVVGLRNIDSEKQTEKALEEALALAQSANRSKTTFLNNMSHDIRTPMNAIIGFTGLAKNHIDSKEQVQSYLDKIEQSSDHLLSLINDVLDMSRIESGKMNLNEKEENLPEIIHTLHDIVQAEVNSKQLDFFIDSVDVNDENIVCDKLRLNQVLLNILSNAIKYTPAGGKIAVRIIEKSVNAYNYGAYQFRIKDNGIGMSKEFLETIFDPFTRVNSSTVSGIQGTGLGMAITKNIVDMMGGKIDIISAPGEGTEVVLDFDFKLARDKAELSPIEELVGLRALVVDDDTNTAISVANMVRDVGMEADWCTSGKEAVLRAKDADRIGNGYRLIIIDWMMAGLNGIETAKRLRKEIMGDIPIIVSTAYDWSDVEDEALEAGITAFASKPLFPSDLHSILEKCIGKEEAEAETVAEDFDFTGKKLLLVEDNEMNREIAVEILEEEGFLVETANDGSVAYDIMAKAKPGDFDLILMDVQMPIMDGYTATAMIRELKTGVENIPIVALSANAFEEDRQKSLVAGMNDHVAKPINVRELKETLAKYL